MQTLGFNHYALTNHLGNVLSVVTDNINISPDSAFAKIVAATDYYAFGSEMPGRTYSSPVGAYRYGFNGKEKDTENTWGDTSYDYGFTIYNPRYGRFLSVDPLTQSYPWYTPYQFAGNKPIWAIDLDGLEERPVTSYREFLEKYDGLVKNDKGTTSESLRKQFKAAMMKTYFIKEINTPRGRRYVLDREAVSQILLDDIKNKNISAQEVSRRRQLYGIAAETMLSRFDYVFDSQRVMDAAFKKREEAIKQARNRSIALASALLREELNKVTFGDVINLTASGAGMIGSIIAIGSGEGAILGFAGYVTSADQFVGSIMTLMDKFDNRYRPNGTYTIGGTISSNVLGDPIYYEITTVFLGGYSSTKAIFKQSGKILDPETVTGILEGIGAINTTINSIEKKAKE